MGNSSNKLPVTEKYLNDFESDISKIGLGEMQGWRGNMEDSSLVHIAKNHNIKNFSNNLRKSTNEIFNEKSVNTKKENNMNNNSYSMNNNTTSNSSYSHNKSTQFDSDVYSRRFFSKEIKIYDEDLEKRIWHEIIDKSPDNNISIIGVFDGHGGSFVSRFVSENFMTIFNNCWLKHMMKDESGFLKNLNKKYLQDDGINSFFNIGSLEQILIKTFLDFDNLLKTKDVQELVQDYRSVKRDNLIIPDMEILSDDSEPDIIQDSFALFMGTTANVVCMYENYLLVANVGDSMSVVFHEGKAIILNTEHKLSEPGERERVLKAGRKILNGRIDGKLNLTRAIGDLQFKDKKLKFNEQAVTAYPEFTTFELNENSEFFISACDGIWDCVEPQKLCEFVSKELKLGKKLSSIIENIENLCLSKTNNSPIGTDNMTLVIFQFK
jgi:serine/threonine protein phosphatase PrpC